MIIYAYKNHTETLPTIYNYKKPAIDLRTSEILTCSEIGIEECEADFPAQHKLAGVHR